MLGHQQLSRDLIMIVFHKVLLGNATVMLLVVKQRFDLHVVVLVIMPDADALAPNRWFDFNSHGDYRSNSRFAPSQWETSLQSNAVSHWQGANLQSTLDYIQEDHNSVDLQLVVFMIQQYMMCMPWSWWHKVYYLVQYTCASCEVWYTAHILYLLYLDLTIQ